MASAQGKHLNTCPVAALRDWIARRSKFPGPLFTRFNAQGSFEQPLQPEPAARTAQKRNRDAEWIRSSREVFRPTYLRAAEHSPEAHETLLQEVHDRRLGVGWIRRRISVYLPRVPSGLPAFAAIHFQTASCASFMRFYGPRWTATAASPPCVSVAYTSPSVSNVRVTSTPKSHTIGARLSRVAVEKNVVAVGPQAGCE